MPKTLHDVVEAVCTMVIMLVLFTGIFIILLGCWLLTMAATDFAQVLQTPPPF